MDFYTFAQNNPILTFLLVVVAFEGIKGITVIVCDMVIRIYRMKRLYDERKKSTNNYE